jgi:hypothetical protein
MAKGLGSIGVILVAIGVIVAGVGAWYVVHARPRVGAEIDRIPVDAHTAFVINAEADGERSFVELRRDDTTLWQALIPHYAGSKGRPALAWGNNAMTVRVERSGRAEVFVLSLRDSAKLEGFRLATEREPITTQPTGPITLTDHVRAYELVGGAGWHELVAVDVDSGHALWKAELGAAPIDAGAIEGDYVALDQAGKHRKFLGSSGVEQAH